jgi:hypothetical protein
MYIVTSKMYRYPRICKLQIFSVLFSMFIFSIIFVVIKKLQCSGTGRNRIHLDNPLTYFTHNCRIIKHPVSSPRFSLIDVYVNPFLFASAPPLNCIR